MQFSRGAVILIYLSRLVLLLSILPPGNDNIRHERIEHDIA